MWIKFQNEEQTILKIQDNFIFSLEEKQPEYYIKIRNKDEIISIGYKKKGTRDADYRLVLEKIILQNN